MISLLVFSKCGIHKFLFWVSRAGPPLCCHSLAHPTLLPPGNQQVPEEEEPSINDTLWGSMLVCSEVRTLDLDLFEGTLPPWVQGNQAFLVSLPAADELLLH